MESEGWVQAPRIQKATRTRRFADPRSVWSTQCDYEFSRLPNVLPAMNDSKRNSHFASLGTESNKSCCQPQLSATVSLRRLDRYRPGEVLSSKRPMEVEVTSFLSIGSALVRPEEVSRCFPAGKYKGGSTGS
ncbi:hypothetical protein E2C01_053411 [Portunus trituberculatus]|uniref:Uncharacterized protein n=1 Tax=Portunus trituberculatus TaxID=210409 RepID=A0A5B7GK92_PORTR|nr:hypothetical protein [Portunus trituberculatus]